MEHSKNGSLLLDERETFGKAYSFGIIVLSAFIFMFGGCGNLLVIFVFGYKQRNKRYHSELLLLLLAISDFILCITLPFLLTHRYILPTEDVSPANVRCIIMEMVCLLNVSTSQVIIILISINRYRLIAAPLQTRISSKMIARILLLALFCSGILCVPFILSFDSFCTRMQFLKHPHFHDIQVSTSFVIYIGIILIRDISASIIMIHLVFKMFKQLKAQELKFRDTNSADRVQKFRNARNIIAAMVICFSICILPESIYTFCLHVVLYSQGIVEGNDLVIELLGATAYLKVLLALSAIINPFIYCKMHPRFAGVRLRIRNMKNLVQQQFQKYRKRPTVAVAPTYLPVVTPLSTQSAKPLHTPVADLCV